MKIKFPRLNNKQLGKSADFLVNLSILIAGLMIFPNLIRVDKFRLTELILGLGVVIVLLFSAIFILRTKK